MFDTEQTRPPFTTVLGEFWGCTLSCTDETTKASDLTRRARRFQDECYLIAGGIAGVKQAECKTTRCMRHKIHHFLRLDLSLCSVQKRGPEAIQVDLLSRRLIPVARPFESADRRHAVPAPGRVGSPNHRHLPRVIVTPPLLPATSVGSRPGPLQRHPAYLFDENLAVV